MKDDPLLQHQMKKETFFIYDLVLRRVFLSSKEPGMDLLGPYCIKEELQSENYKIENLD